MKRSVRIGPHSTSVSLEDAFWKDIHEIAAIRNVLLSDLPLPSTAIAVATFPRRSAFSSSTTIAPKLTPANRLSAARMKMAARLTERRSETFVGCRIRRDPCRGELGRHIAHIVPL